MINKVLTYSCLFSCLFPWVSFRIIDGDIQPYFIIFSLLFFIFNINKKVPLFIWSLLLLPLFSILIALTYKVFDFLSIRAVISYSAPFLVSYFIYIVKIRKLTLVFKL